MSDKVKVNFRAYAEMLGVCPGHLHRVVRGERDSVPLLMKIERMCPDLILKACNKRRMDSICHAVEAGRKIYEWDETAKRYVPKNKGGTPPCRHTVKRRKGS